MKSTLVKIMLVATLGAGFVGTAVGAGDENGGDIYDCPKAQNIKDNIVWKHVLVRRVALPGDDGGVLVTYNKVESGYPWNRLEVTIDNSDGWYDQDWSDLDSMRNDLKAVGIADDVLRITSNAGVVRKFNQVTQEEGYEVGDYYYSCSYSYPKYHINNVVSIVLKSVPVR